MLDRQKRGYMTIEATLVMPFIVMGIVFIIYIGFYLYDVCIIRQISYVAALRTSKQLDFTETQMEGYARKQLEELRENRLLVIKKWEETIEVNMRKIEINIFAEVSMPFRFAFFQKLGMWEIKSEAQVIRVNPVEIIRKLRGSNDS